MTRLLTTWITISIVFGVGVAYIAAQEASWVRRSEGVQLTQHLRGAGQAVTAEYQQGLGGQANPSLNGQDPPRTPQEPFVLVAATEDEPAGGLRSVLTRRSTLADPAQQAAEPSSRHVEQPPMLETNPDTETSALSPLAPPIVPSRPLDVESEYAPLEPPASLPDAGPSMEDTAPIDDTPLTQDEMPSSRRVHRDAPQLSSPSSIAATPAVVPERQASAGPAPSSRTSDKLNSSTGALLRVDTVGPEAIAVGETADLTVSLTNMGVTEAHEASVRVALPQHLELVSSQVEEGTARVQQESISGSVLVWSIDHLPARAQRRMMLRVIPRTAAPLELPIEWSVAPLASVTRIQVQQPRLELFLQGPSEVVYGDTKLFTVTVSNPGDGDARHVSLRLSLGEESGDDLEIGTLAAGGSRKYEVEVTARQAGSLAISAIVQGAHDLRAEARELIQVRRAELMLETAGSGRQYAGSVGTYQVRVINQGDAVAENLVALVQLPASADYLRGLEQAEQHDDRLTWPVGRLAAGEERTYRFFCQLNQPGDARFDIAVRNDRDLETANSLVTRVEAMADLKMTVSDPASPVPMGEDVLYEIQVVNRGSRAANQVQVIAQFSDGIEPVAVEGSPAELVPGQAVFEPIVQVNPGQTITLKVKAKADREGSHIFRAELRCNDPEYRLVAEDTTTFYDSGLMVSPGQSTSSSDAPAGSAARAPRWGAETITR
jgi:uncharacterized repeat protein (TIGR01451 family)